MRDVQTCFIKLKRKILTIFVLVCRTEDNTDRKK